MADPKNKKNDSLKVKTSKYGFTYTSREDRAQKLTNLHRLRYGKGKGQPSIHYGDDNNKWKKQGLPNTSSPINMKKQYKVKDLNKNGKIDGWEQGKYNAINSATPMKMGYAMKMGSKENYSPTNFKTKDAMLMAESPMYMIGGNFDPNKKDNSLSMYGDYADPSSGSYIVNVTKNQQDQINQQLQDMNQGYQQGGYSKSGSYDEVMYEGGLNIGEGLYNIFKPKPGSQAEKQQQARKQARKEIREQQGGTVVGNKLREVFRGKKVKQKIGHPNQAAQKNRQAKRQAKAYGNKAAKNLKKSLRKIKK
jgi:hypothetical protein